MLKVVLAVLLLLFVASPVKADQLVGLEPNTVRVQMINGHFKKGHYYLLSNDIGLPVVQSLKNGVLVNAVIGSIGFPGMESADWPGDKIFFLETPKKYADGDLITDFTCVQYLGIVHYVTVLGAESAIHGFKQVSCKQFIKPVPKTTYIACDERLKAVESAIRQGEFTKKDIRAMKVLSNDYALYKKHNKAVMKHLWQEIDADKDPIKVCIFKVKGAYGSRMGVLLLNDFYEYKKGEKSFLPGFWSQVSRLPNKAKYSFSDFSIPDNLLIQDAK